MIHCICVLWNSVYVSNSFCFVCLGSCCFVYVGILLCIYRYLILSKQCVNNAINVLVTWELQIKNIMRAPHSFVVGMPKWKKKSQCLVLSRRNRYSHTVGHINWHKDFGKVTGFTTADQYTRSLVSSTLWIMLLWTVLYVSYSKYILYTCIRMLATGLFIMSSNWRPKCLSMTKLINRQTQE